jgi:hypothetical protein
MSFIYQARDLANRIPNSFYIPGDGLPRETYESTVIFNYSVTNTNWTAARLDNISTVSNTVLVVNRFSAPSYTISRTGIQFSTTWGVVPVGMKIEFVADTEENLPFKIRVFKGTTTTLTGDESEYKTPIDEGLVPFSEELEVTSLEGSLSLYFNQTAIDAFLANPDQNIFILGEYDYNDIEPTVNYTVGDTNPANFVGLSGQT